MKYIEKQILKKINTKLTLRNKIILFIFKRYTYIIYNLGYKDGFYYTIVDNVNDLSTMHKF